MFRFFMNEAGGEGASGGGAAASLLNQGTQQAAPAIVAAPQLMSDGWLKGLDSALATDPSMKDIQDLPNLVKSFVNSQKMIGRDKITLPTEYATPEEWSQIYEKLGAPKDPKDYKFNEKFSYDEEYLTDFKQFARDNGLLPRQAEAMLKRLQAEDQDIITREDQGVQEALENSMTTLQKEFGQALPQKLNIARNALAGIADETMQQYVEDSGMANDPQFIKFLVTIGEKFFKEDGAHVATSQGGALSPADAQNKINDTMGNSKHPYWDGSHPGHAQAVADMQKLFSYTSM